MPGHVMSCHVMSWYGRPSLTLAFLMSSTVSSLLIYYLAVFCLVISCLGLTGCVWPYFFVLIWFCHCWSCLDLVCLVLISSCWFALCVCICLCHFAWLGLPLISLCLFLLGFWVLWNCSTKWYFAQAMHKWQSQHPSWSWKFLQRGQCWGSECRCV